MGLERLVLHAGQHALATGHRGLDLDIGVLERRVRQSVLGAGEGAPAGRHIATESGPSALVASRRRSSSTTLICSLRLAVGQAESFRFPSIDRLDVGVAPQRELPADELAEPWYGHEFVQVV